MKSSEWLVLRGHLPGGMEPFNFIVIYFFNDFT